MYTLSKSFLVLGCLLINLQLFSESNVFTFDLDDDQPPEEYFCNFICTHVGFVARDASDCFIYLKGPVTLGSMHADDERLEIIRPSIHFCGCTINMYQTDAEFEKFAHAIFLLADFSE